MHTFSQHVYRHTDEQFFPCRLWQAATAIHHQHGWAASATFGLSCTIASIAAIAFAYFCMEGTVRSFMEAASQEESALTRIRPLGDAGGWLSLVLFSAIALKSILEGAVREAEYFTIQKLFKQQNALNLEDGANDALYSEVCTLLDESSARAIFTRSLTNRRISALQLFNSMAELKEGPLARDLRLQKSLVNIDTHMHMSNVFCRYKDNLLAGHTAIRKLSGTSYTTALIFSLALPTIFIANACLSLIGEVGLGKDLFYNRTDLADTGHFGEWPINACEALSVAWLLHLWYLVNEGRFRLTKKAYKQEMKLLSDPLLQQQLQELGNRELAEISQTCHHVKYPFHYINKTS